MKPKRLLLLQYKGNAGDRRAARLLALGFDVVAADPHDLHWPKMVSGGNWSAVIVDLDCLHEIAVEVAAELEDYPDTEKFKVLLLGGDVKDSGDLPTPLRGGLHVRDERRLVEILKSEM